MNASSLFRFSILALFTSAFFATPLLGCDFLDLEDDDTVIIEENDDNGEEPIVIGENDDNDENDKNDSNDSNNGNDSNDENDSNNDNNTPPPTEPESAEIYDDYVSLFQGYSNDVTIHVPDNAISMGVSVTDGPGDAFYAITDWQGPNGFEVVRSGWETESQLCYPNCNTRVMLQAGATAALAPNNPDSQVDPGTHTFQVFGVSSAGYGLSDSVRVQVHVHTADDAVPQNGELDLNLFFSGVEGWTASSAPTDPEVQNMLADLDVIFDQVNIDIGEVAYHDISSDYQYIQDLQSGDGDLAQLFSESSAATVDGPSVFMVAELSGGGSGGALGIAGGIPGPMHANGSPGSGVAIAVDSLGGWGAPSFAHVVGHELGHYLGLFHTTEQTNHSGMPGHDPLPDTAENDDSYLMHATGVGNDLSVWQGRVMRKNPWTVQD